MRIATWNVNRPKPNGWKIPPAQRERMAGVHADVWVLTETHLAHSPTDEHLNREFSPEHPARRPAHERWTAIWSRWPLTLVTDPAAHERGTVAATVTTPDGPVLVYGTVIAWSHEPFDDGRPAPGWDVHRAEIERQGKEWVALRAAHPRSPFVLAGDFNQSRDGSRWYGSQDVRGRLGAALAAADLTCVTDEDVVSTGKLKIKHLVDHICVSPDLVRGALLSCRENVDETTGHKLSDHPIVIVDLPTA